MKHIGLFEGIGGFSLAARWMGWKTIAWCEINPFGQQVLKYHYPNAKGHSDIKTTDFSIYRGQCDILTGGFPCQPYSTAGKRLGKEDDRHLWPEMLRAVREISPRWILGENVRGLTNWNGGMVFDEVQADLETEGYEVTPFLLPACAVNAPHRRDRIWFVAHRVDQEQREPAIGGLRAEFGDGGRLITDTGIYGPHGPKNGQGVGEGNDNNQAGQNEAKQSTGRSIQEQFITHPECQRQSGQRRAKYSGNTSEDGNWKASWSYDDGRWPLESPICSRNDGLSSGLDGITFSKWRQESIKAYGNAIVPQVALQIFKAIEQYENQTL